MNFKIFPKLLPKPRGVSPYCYFGLVGVNFAVGVVTSIPMEFQFGTNWVDFSRYAGDVVGQTLAMEGMFAFSMESALVGAFIWGEKRLDCSSFGCISHGPPAGENGRKTLGGNV